MDILQDEPTVSLLLPLVAAVAVALCFLGALRFRRGQLNILEVGPIYVGTVTVYTVFPLLVLLWNYYGPAPANDPRFVRAPPAAADIGLIGWFFVVHLAAFAAAYVLISGRAAVGLVRFRNLKKGVMPCALGLYLLIAAFLLWVDYDYDLWAETYAETYLVTDRLPTVLGQVYRVLRDSRYVLEVVVLVVLGTRWRQTYPLIAGWVAGIIVLTFLRGGERGSMVLLLGAVAITYQHLVRPLRLWEAALGALVLLFMFNLAGFLRSEADRTDAGAPFDLLGHHTEFESIFANAYDVYDLQRTGQISELPWSWHASDLVALIPPQLLPFEKTNKARWYVETYYPEYAARGGGLAFGVVAESILGWGWLDLVLRGLVLGLILGLAQRYWARHQDSLWVFVFYVWLATFCYWPFRWTAFVLLPLFVWRFLPIYCALRLLTTAFSRLAAPAQAAADDYRPRNP